jgi:hypothetical protein
MDGRLLRAFPDVAVLLAAGWALLGLWLMENPRYVIGNELKLNTRETLKRIKVRC